MEQAIELRVQALHFALSLHSSPGTGEELVKQAKVIEKYLQGEDEKDVD